MGIIEKIKYYSKRPNEFRRNTLNYFARFIDNDASFIKMKWKLYMDYPLSLDNPQTFNEKIQWLKLYDRKLEYIRMVDKYEAKKYVASIIGDEYIIPTLSVYDHAEDINFDELPNQFVLKCTHDSGGIVICKDKSKINFDKARDTLKKSLNRNYFYQSREWPYKEVKPRIIAEEYKEDKSGELNDYKWFCFNGEPKVLFIATDRGNPNEETKFDFFDMDFNHLPITNGHPNSTREIKRPDGFDKMREIASMLSKDIPHVRVDLYDVNGKIYFGEYTFSHWSGMVPFVPREWDYRLGSWLKLPNK